VVTVLASFAASIVTASRTAKATMRSAQEPTIAANMERYVDWQMLKRKLYTEFLAAARHLKEGADDDNSRKRYMDLRDQVLLYANSDAPQAIVQLPDSPVELDEKEWDHLKCHGLDRASTRLRAASCSFARKAATPPPGETLSLSGIRRQEGFQEARRRRV
jgi:hypothetical protein